MARNDEAVEVEVEVEVEVDTCGLNALDTVKALIKATGLNPHVSVYGWMDGVDNMEGGAV